VGLLASLATKECFRYERVTFETWERVQAVFVSAFQTCTQTGEAQLDVAVLMLGPLETSEYRNHSLVFLTTSESNPKARIMTVLNPIPS